MDGSARSGRVRSEGGGFGGERSEAERSQEAMQDGLLPVPAADDPGGQRLDTVQRPAPPKQDWSRRSSAPISLSCSDSFRQHGRTSRDACDAGV